MALEKKLKNKVKQGLLLAGALGTIALCSGCATPIASKQDVLKYWQKTKASQTQELAARNSEKLRENEYVLPDKVIDAFAKVVDKSPAIHWAGGPAAGYLSRNFLAN